MPARSPLGALSPAMGQLGFALPAATGLSLGCPDRPVVAVMGDGASLYSVQGLWTAAHYGAGPLIVVLANGGYAIMDRLAEQQGGGGPWPGFGIDIAGLARSFGCSARSLATHAELVEALDDAVPRLGATREPLLLEVAVEPEPTFAS
jgi:benzoylformate decarboxylase